MFENALISVNWSGTSVDAAALARSLCSGGAQLTLAHVHAEVPMSPDPLVMHLRKFELRQSMRALKGAAYATQVTPTLSVGAPSVAVGVGGLLGMIGADLLVVGPVDRQGPELTELSEWLTGPRAGVPGAIAVAKPGFCAEATSVRRVGVISDGSADDECVLTVARELAGHLGSRLKTFEIRAGTAGPRRRAMAERRLAQFSAGVDLLIASDPVMALSHSAVTTLLIITRSVPARGSAQLSPAAAAAGCGGP